MKQQHNFSQTQPTYAGYQNFLTQNLEAQSIMEVQGRREQRLTGGARR
jgi:hypothetical protein